MIIIICNDRNMIIISSIHNKRKTKLYPIKIICIPILILTLIAIIFLNI